MPYEESKKWRKGNRQATYYADDLSALKRKKNAMRPIRRR